MSGLMRLPAEILVEIVNQCDTLQQLIALASTCKRIRSLLSPSTTVLCLGRSEILAFDDALIAVRATAIAQEYLANGNLPPDPFPFHQLSPEVNWPSFSELINVFLYEHLVKCFEYIMWNDKVERIKESPEIWTTWRAGLHASMYRSLLVGAVLCRPYQEPFVPSKKDRPHDFLHAIEKGIAKNKRVPFLNFDSTDIQYLLKYPAYRFGDHEARQPIFGPLADFLVRSSKSRAHRHQRSDMASLFGCMGFALPSDLTGNEASTVFADLVQLLYTYYRLNGLYADLAYAHKRNGESQSSRIPSQENTNLQYKKVTVIIPGSFSPDEFHMPRQVEEAAALLGMRPAGLPSKADVPSPRFPHENVDILLKYWHHMSGQPNYYGGLIETHQPHYEFFQFLCQSHLGLRFSQEAFSWVDLEGPYSLWQGEDYVFYQRRDDIQMAAEMFVPVETKLDEVIYGTLFDRFVD